jgi:hypothetical protein
MKQNNVMMYDTFMWNWLRFSLCGDAIFIASCINYAFVYEIWGLMPKEKIVLGMQLQDLSCCIGFMNDIFIKIQKLWNNEAHWI